MSRDTGLCQQVQHSLADYFYGTREEKFFFAIKNRIDLSTIALKEQRSLAAQYMAKVDEAIEMAKALKKAMATAKIAAKVCTYMYILTYS